MSGQDTPISFVDLEEALEKQREDNAAFLSNIAKGASDPDVKAMFESFAARAAHPNGWGKAYDQLGLYQITDSEYANSRMGYCDMRGKLKDGDLALCVGHSGDYFHDFILLDVENEYISVRPDSKFCGYAGMGEKVGALSVAEFLSLTEFAVPQRVDLGLKPS